MFDIKIIREKPEYVKEGCQKKQIKVDIDRLLEVDKERREVLQILEKNKAEKNKGNKDIMSTSTEEERDSILKKMKEIKEKDLELEEKFKTLDKEFNKLIRQVPNIPFDEVPVGEDEESNEVIRKEGKIPEFDFTPKNHLTIGEELNIIDTKRAAKTSGARFAFIKGEAALIQFALINLAFEVAGKKGFTPVVTPVMLKPEMMEAMGFMERGKDDIFYLEKDDLYLIGTSEQAIGPMHAGEVFEEKELPKRYIGYSSCFRREAGSYGKDTKGILRVHQFDKIEMFSFVTPSKSKEEHELLLSIEEELMQLLEIPYQVIDICSGDLGDPAAKKYDIEAWMPGQNKYRETHSTSNCTDFQARGLNIRYKNNEGTFLVHTLNGTALAIGRIIIAILENNQTKEGDIRMPKVLHKYLPFTEIKKH